MPSTDFSIRPVRTADNAAVAAIIRTVMPEFGAGGPGFAIHDAEVDAMAEAYAIPRAAYFVVEADGEVLGGGGVAALAGGDADTCELRKMYFLPALRGRGAGRALIERCLATARTFGYRRCYLETLSGMDAAQALYLKSGFRRIAGPMGGTGHFSCDKFYLIDL
ncbi:GNAT family N-acetyltransferase [Tahibacter caeni]|uniref:GNAT family N-acetyltransferase n=1 Tax=Tahibacter caeni TaxID=1453545 RepID=UPI002147CDF4|nr:GNAT family N-acetyltransferase [Tahibacter caeni]